MSDAPFEDLSPEAFQAFLKANAPGPETLGQNRARLDRRADEIALPTDCECAPVTIGGWRASGSPR